MSTDGDPDNHNYLSDADDEVAPTTAAGGGVISTEGNCLSQQLYVDAGNEKKVLYLFCIGLNRSNDSNEPLFSFQQEPSWSFLPKNLLRPRNVDYFHEITRRATFYNIAPAPRPNNWTRAQIMEWLEQNPVCDPPDITFLTNEVLRLEDVLSRRVQEQQGLDGNARTIGGNNGGRMGYWRGAVPYLCVIMCLTHNNVKCLFLTRANARTRQEIDGRNSDNR